MIRNLLALTGVLFVANIGLNAQVCTPNTSITEPGLYPTDLPDAEVGIVYSEVIQFKFPSDTTVSGNTVPVDSVHITEVSGFPSGFTYQCNKSGCRYLGGENGCVVISGNPTANQTGDYNLSVKGIGYVNFGGSVFPVTFDETLTFSVTNGTFINENKSTVSDISLYPNPFSVSTKISFFSNSPGNAILTVSDLAGKQVNSATVLANTGSNIVEFNRGDLKTGVYFYTLKVNESVLTGRMLIVD